MKLLAIDGNSILNRAFYGIKLLTTKNGEFTNGIYGFLSILLRMLEETQPDAVACAFDMRGPTFRHNMFCLLYTSSGSIFYRWDCPCFPHFGKAHGGDASAS